MYVCDVCIYVCVCVHVHVFMRAFLCVDACFCACMHVCCVFSCISTYVVACALELGGLAISFKGLCCDIDILFVHKFYFVLISLLSTIAICHPDRGEGAAFITYFLFAL